MEDTQRRENEALLAEDTQPPSPEPVLDPEAEIAPARERAKVEAAKTHDEGSGANETDDGLDEIDEAVRHAAEDTPTGQSDEVPDSMPVFDRGDTTP